MHSFQSVFDTVAAAIIKQGVPSTRDDEDGDAVCVYRGDGGVKCAAGHLIPDEEYDPKMEGIQASWVAGCTRQKAYLYEGPFSPTLKKIIDMTGVEFVNTLQAAHDMASEEPHFLDGYRRRMERIAGRRGLNTDVLDAPASN